MAHYWIIEQKFANFRNSQENSRQVFEVKLEALDFNSQINPGTSKNELAADSGFYLQHSEHKGIKYIKSGFWLTIISY